MSSAGSSSARPLKEDPIPSYSLLENMHIGDTNVLTACARSWMSNPRPQQGHTSSQLLRLPVEIQHDIFLKVERKDLHALSQTCAILRDTLISLKLLIEHIVLSALSPRHKDVIRTLEAKISTSEEAARSIRHLELVSNSVDSDVLARILPHTPKLKSLVYTYRIRNPSEPSDEEDDITNSDYADTAENINVASIADLLFPVRHTLIRLDLQIDGNITPKIYNFGDPRFFDAAMPNVRGALCLKQMSALRYLKLSSSFLLDGSCEDDPRIKLEECLPPALVELEVTWDPWTSIAADEWEPVVADFLSDRKRVLYMPFLDTISWDPERVGPPGGGDRGWGLLRLTRENGLTFTNGREL